ncbi:hypothetical protein K491DRAFT_325592 [Lophiostoma macrostomum CBS 122681]|uniref:Uncharacterized protein n=1 Tax=Lophiostoma macrostomum CBS 122681 TaxID=1314788 RepID=A0A6A6SHF5_9PLEO|nr:hypothetical protein K491DRAFT_325592 [Lophiostoma macrostomum CBS 122681]
MRQICSVNSSLRPFHQRRVREQLECALVLRLDGHPLSQRPFTLSTVDAIDRVKPPPLLTLILVATVFPRQVLSLHLALQACALKRRLPISTEPSGLPGTWGRFELGKT